MKDFIDAAVEQFAHDHTEPESDLTSVSARKPIECWIGRRCKSDVIEGRFLKMLVRVIGVRTILEVGTFTDWLERAHDGRSFVR
ncbi:MAG: hypothetical protein QOI49_429 [Verrucomicrobiota bacterium]|jgi:predicted O-methyltransferase YrrM